jgi:tRNA 2-thiouridine synthesizing protein A
VEYGEEACMCTTELHADCLLDCLGLFCPMPIVKTREAMRTMAAGQVLEMRSDDPASDADMRSWARRTGNELVAVTKDGAIYRFLVRKTR